jgi:hypothetical protein
VHAEYSSVLVKWLVGGVEGAVEAELTNEVVQLIERVSGAATARSGGVSEVPAHRMGEVLPPHRLSRARFLGLLERVRKRRLEPLRAGNVIHGPDQHGRLLGMTASGDGGLT